MSINSVSNARARRRRALPLALAVVAVALFCSLAPSFATAEESEVVAYSIDADNKRTDYTSISDAVNAGLDDAHPTICMEEDWMLASAIEIPAGKKLTIDMRGHIIGVDFSKYTKSSADFNVRKGAELTLTSTKTKQITYKGFDSSSGSTEIVDVTTTTGGLVTEGAPKSTWACPIVLEESSTLNMNGIILGGNNGSNAGGVYMMGKNSTLKMTNGASIEYNWGTFAGGIGTFGENVTIEMDQSFVRKNRSEGQGGGIGARRSGTIIEMTGGSEISGNLADAGGGVYFLYSNFELTSSDGNAFISDNVAEHSDRGTEKDAQSGGGIHVDQSRLESNYGLIEGITISGNYSAYDGGGIELDQENTTLKNCTIKDNWCKYEGGGVYVCNDDNTIDGCTITGNACNVNDEGKNYEGGGVFVWHSYDIGLKGKCTIKDNTRGKGTDDADDVMLRENGGASAKAYITGSLTEGSSVGVRTGIAKSDRRIAKNFTYPESKDCLFMDLDGYFVTYGTDEHGDAWQRYGTKEFDLKVNGKSVGRFGNGTAVTANGTSANESRVFKCWDAEGSTGLYPFSDYIGDSGLKNPTVSFKMPQNDVNLVASYVTRVSEVTLSVDAPVAGKALPTTGTLSWKDGNGNAHEKEVALSWLEKSGDKWVSASGDAKYGATYAAEVSVDQDLDSELAFALDIDASKQTVKIGGTDVGAASASVDAAGALRMRTKGCTTEKPTVTSVEVASVTVQEGATEAEFRKLLPATAVARTNAGTAVKLGVDASEGDLSALVEDGKVKKPADGKAVTVRIPLKSSDEVTVPSGKDSVAVEVTVTDAPKTAPEAPTVSPDEGTYSTADDAGSFTDGSLKVTASCKTEGAAIRYRLDRCDDGWVDDAAAHDYGDGIALAKKGDDQRLYELEIWSVKDGLESGHGFFLYVIDDIQDVTVTVKGTDTGIGPKTETLETHPVRKGASLTVTAPDREGYAFEKWVDSNGAKLSTSTAYTLAKVDGNTTVTAVYNPVVSGLDVYLDIPEADKALAESATQVKAKIGESADYADVTSYFKGENGKVAVAWLPSDEKAAHDTCYTASLALNAPDSGSVKYVLSPALSVRVNGKDVNGGAYAVKADGKTSVCIECPNTGPYEEPSVADLGTVEMSFADAWASWKKAGDDQAVWASGLPDQAKVTYKCGESEMYDITWTSIGAFDEDATEGQTFIAEGTVTWPDYVSNTDSDGKLVSNEVTVSVKVAAKEAVKAPTASVKRGTHKGTQQVELSCETDRVTIRYTTDGSDPTEENGETYDGMPIEVAHNATIKARAYADGMKPSEVAKFDYEIQHEVKFDSAGGSDVESQWVTDGGCATEPKVPTYRGYTFDGWYAQDGEKPVEYDFSNPVTADLKLVAHWSKKAAVTHAVTFDAAGGSDVAAQTVEDGGCATEPEAPTRKGYDFAGWTLDGKAFDFSTPVKSDLELKATWKRRESKKEETDNQKGTETKTTTVTTVTTSADSNLAATGDRALLIVGLLAALGILAAAAGILAKRKKR